MEADRLIGHRLGSYEVQSILATGGTSRVYRGFDRTLQRPVAIKVLFEEVASAPNFAWRFRQEGILLAGLRHPNIVQILDFGEHNGALYMVQEFLPGPTLDGWVNELAAHKQRPTPLEIIHVVRQIAHALDVVHAIGVIHRDIKPSNVLWSAAGELVLTDFGIAQRSLVRGNTARTDEIFGTPGYLSPEHAQGLPVSPASDIYALGVLLYELITGVLPFDGATPADVMLQHVHATVPPLRTRCPTLPPGVEAVVQRALAKDPAARFQRASELAYALRHTWFTATITGGSRTPLGGNTRSFSTLPSSPLRRSDSAPHSRSLRVRGGRLLGAALLGGALLGGAGWMAQGRSDWMRVNPSVPIQPPARPGLVDEPAQLEPEFFAPAPAAMLTVAAGEIPTVAPALIQSSTGTAAAFGEKPAARNTNQPGR
jgi:serine/threonine-protein kinase